MTAAPARYAVLGQPVGHSKSPRIHAAFAAASAQTMTYDAIEIAPDALAERLAAFHAEGWAGFNLTVPHKEAGFAVCVSRTPAAEAAGAVNTLIREAQGWRGDNTDGAGLLRDLAVNLGLELAGRRVLILGAGGAARGIVGPLLAAGPAQLVVSNRTPWKPEAIAAAFKDQGPIVPRTHLALKGDRYDLILNATSAGHGGETPKLPPQLFADGGVAYDLNYGPAARPFLDWAGANGATAGHDGLGMLVEQAAEAFAAWRGLRPDTAAILASLRAG